MSLCCSESGPRSMILPDSHPPPLSSFSLHFTHCSPLLHLTLPSPAFYFIFSSPASHFTACPTRCYTEWVDTNYSTQWCYENYVQVRTHALNLNILLCLFLSMLCFTLLCLTQHGACKIVVLDLNQDALSMAPSKL